MNNTNNVFRQSTWFKAQLLIMGALLSHCGKQSFDVIDSAQTFDGPGVFYTPKKVDIVFAVDNSGSMLSQQAALTSKISGLLNSLEQKKWFYRFSSIPLLPGSSQNCQPGSGDFTAFFNCVNGQKVALSQVAANRYDPNWGNLWIPPTLNAVPEDDKVDPSFFVKPENFATFPSADLSNSVEPGLVSVASHLLDATYQSKLIRPEAQGAFTVVVLISNGDDTSEAPATEWPFKVPGTVNTTIIDKIKSSKSPAAVSKLKLYSLVNTTGNTCFNASTKGSRYMDAAAKLGGKAYDLCAGSDPFSNAFDSLQTDLAALGTNYVREFVGFQEDVVITSVVKVLENGSQLTLSEDASGTASSGFSYIGFGTHPSYILQIGNTTQTGPNETGYFIQLLGTSKLKGDEKLLVKFRPRVL